MYVLFFMVISGNMLSQLSAIETLNGLNFGSWRETIEIVLALWEIDLTLMTDAPAEPAEPMIRKGEATKAFATRQRDFTSIKMAYDLEHVKWDASNHKCLMVIKSSIKEAISGGILNCETAKEYLKVENQFTGSSKTYASTIIKRLVMEKYSFDSGVREHILKMSNMLLSSSRWTWGSRMSSLSTWLCRPCPRNLRLLRLTITPSLKAGELKNSSSCAYMRRRGLRSRVVILSTT
jgi:hypothetical protein